MNIILQKDKCLSCGMCASLTPELFTIDSGIVECKKDLKTWDTSDWEKAKEAALACPNTVIEITE
jgi:ferredoxin